MPADLLFEIGCEEIPAKMLARQLVDVPAFVELRLAAARLEHKGVRALGTPRRLAVIVKQLVDRQPDLHEEVVGPPVSAAFAPDGTLTKAGQGFAAKNGVAPESLQKKQVAGKKGEYVVAVRDVTGQDARALLPNLLSELAASIAWPKSQRWGWSETTFVRPVQWLVAVHGGEVVPLTWAGHTAGRSSRGHRFLSPGPIEIASADSYVEALRGAHVVVDPDARKDLVRAELKRLEGATGLRVRADETLLGEVIHLGEYPVGVSGEFDPAFLEIPEEIIVTSMRTHQRYFAMERPSDGKLANRFATMMATIVKDPTVVQKGNQKVLASRLTDGKFFVSEDRKKKSFDFWNTKLDSVVFQAKLGDKARTIGHKVRRLEKIAAALGTFASLDAAQIELVKQAARVCKADLASLAVGEFPELQGVMGRHYARDFGLPTEVAAAIDEHWWPKGQGAALPITPAGAIIALADRMDTIVGCFAVGLEPSGSADPFGLRRAAIGIWQILLSRPDWSSLWTPLFAASRDALSEQGVTVKEPTAVEEFFRGRLRGILIDGGIPAQDADAALAQDFRDPIDARARALACAKISKEAREVFKRVSNILDDARGKKLAIPDKVDAAKFVADVERNLHAAVADAQTREKAPRASRDYPAVFDSLERLRPTVAAFFDKGGVMVMDPDPALRDNRLALLQWFIEPYLRIADFRLLAGAA
ncbi:MAG: glycine--tRNA ligase subunit beta [Deltaproteobacteria bacterium]|nr:glycine--tRNA ligase subunit beta [Deltaproteobacteria bacterium]